MNVFLIVAVGAIVLSILMRAIQGKFQTATKSASPSSYRRSFWHIRAVTILAMLLVFLELAKLPVTPYSDATSTAGRPIVYAPFPERAYIAQLRTLLNRQPVCLVGPSRAASDVANAFPEATFEPLSNLVDGVDYGPTVQASLLHLRGKLTNLQGAGSDAKVYFLMPTTDDITRDHAEIELLIEKHPWLADRLVCLFPGEGRLTTWPLPSITEIHGPRQISQDSTEYTADIHAIVPNGFQGQLEVTLHGDGRMSHATFDAAGNAVWNASTSSKTIVTQAFNNRLKLKAPAAGSANTLIVRLYSKFGQPISQSVLMTRTEPPEVAVLLPKDSKETSELTRLFGDLSLPVKQLRLDLTNAAAVDANARELEPWNVVLIDVSLSKSEAQIFAASLERRGQSGKAPTPLFVGMSGKNSVSEGWRLFLPKAENATISRRIVIALDWSGSMDDKPLGKRNADVAIDSVIAMAKGLDQRDHSQMIMVLDPNGNEIIAKYDPATKRGPVEMALDSMRGWKLDGGDWEMGPQLVRIALLAQSQPISDAILFVDNRDTHGPGRGDNDGLNQDAIDAARALTAKGVRLHIVSVGGSLSDKIPADIRAFQKVAFKDQKDLASLQAALQDHVFDVALPRLQVVREPKGCAALPQSGQDKLNKLFGTSITVPDVLLHTPLGPFRPLASVLNPSDVLLYVKHWQHDQVSPFFYRSPYTNWKYEANQFVEAGNAEAYHLALDLQSETALLPSGLSSRAPALADLLIASISTVAQGGLRRPPVTWEIDDRGQVVAVGRDGRLFNLAAGGVHVPPNCSLQLEKLNAPTWKFHHLDNTKPTLQTVELIDTDPSIGKQSARLPLVGSPPLPLRSSADRALVGKPLVASPSITPTNRENRLELSQKAFYALFTFLVTCCILVVIRH